jgi:hypothetical protein
VRRRLLWRCFSCSLCVQMIDMLLRYSSITMSLGAKCSAGQQQGCEGTAAILCAARGKSLCLCKSRIDVDVGQPVMDV